MWGDPDWDVSCVIDWTLVIFPTCILCDHQFRIATSLSLCHWLLQTYSFLLPCPFSSIVLFASWIFSLRVPCSSSLTQLTVPSAFLGLSLATCDPPLPRACLWEVMWKPALLCWLLGLGMIAQSSYCEQPICRVSYSKPLVRLCSSETSFPCLLVIALLPCLGWCYLQSVQQLH